VIEFKQVSKAFRQGAGTKLLRQYVTNMLRGRRPKLFYALRDVSFRVERGGSMAVVGHNGAGKSTLLALVAGLTRPSKGSVAVEGRMAALLELGSGFHVELTGRENLRLNASLLGLSRRRTAELTDKIIAFAEIGEFINEPLRTYSAGMIMRLAFSVAILAEPDILIVDEVLAVGDQAFQEKCLEQIRRYKAAGHTLLCVSHDSGLVRELCDRALWLDRGAVVREGPAAEVLDAYAAHDRLGGHRTE
jgi:ABC-type polysaccharide/polyol phosphate transport system ATPase subunit